MLILSVVVFYLLLWLIILKRGENFELRHAFLKALLLFFAFIAIATEILSFFQAINRMSIFFVWFGGSLVLLGAFRRKIRTEPLNFRQNFSRKIKSAPKIYLVLITFIYAVVFLIGLFSPPNTYDSMSYHLARVANWIQFGTVEFYPTAILRQLYQMPLAEYAILHFQLLSGGDYFANLVQWFCFVGCSAAVTLIVKEFGAAQKTQFFAGLLATTVPMAIVQSTGTQNDLVVSVFVLAFFYFWLRAVKSNAWTDFSWTGLALALALLAKGTAYIFCFPIGAMFVGVHFFTLKTSAARARFVKQVAFVLVLAVAFSAAHLARNWQLFGSPISTGEEQMSNRNLSANMVFSNLSRNYAIHLGTPLSQVNDFLENNLRRIFGDELKNPDSTWMNEPFFIRPSLHEDSAGNLLHVLLISSALVLAYWLGGSERKYALILAVSILTGFVLYSVLLKWQPWASRLQLPIFLLGCALIALVVERFTPSRAASVALICFLAAQPILFFSSPRGVWNAGNAFILNESRAKNYFKNDAGLEPSYTEAVEFVKSQPDAERVGLHIGFNDFEYPFWVLAKRDFREPPRFYHVGVENVSAKLIDERPLPNLVISNRGGSVIEGIEYAEIWRKAPVRILRKKGTILP